MKNTLSKEDLDRVLEIVGADKNTTMDITIHIDGSVTATTLLKRPRFANGLAPADAVAKELALTNPEVLKALRGLLEDVTGIVTRDTFKPDKTA